MTAQVHENLIDEGNRTTMACCPPLPELHPRIQECSDPEAQLPDEDSIIFSTACWRAYIGTWELKEGRLYLTDLKGRYTLAGSEPLFAEWFTGELRVPRGERLAYVHSEFDSVYEEELHIRIQKGRVTGRTVVDHRGKFPDQGPYGP